MALLHLYQLHFGFPLFSAYVLMKYTHKKNGYTSIQFNSIHLYCHLPEVVFDFLREIGVFYKL